MARRFIVTVIASLFIQCGSASPVPQNQDGCPAFCPAIFAPVCGTDGKTYPSVCNLKADACNKGTNVEVSYEGECVESKNGSAAQKECNGKCNRQFKPVCGSDGKTYNNDCLLELAACQTGEVITKEKDGPCVDESDIEREGKDAEKVEEDSQDNEAAKTDSPTTVTDDECKRHCSRQFKPVCGSDGKTYSNICMLETAACNSETGIFKASDGQCDKEAREAEDEDEEEEEVKEEPLVQACNGKCNRDFRPVCGSDGNTYNNECLLQFAACKSPSDSIVKAHNGSCAEKQQKEGDILIAEKKTPNSKDCPTICNLIWRPVCGSDGVTYGNECNLKSKACTSKVPITVAHTGECEEKADEETTTTSPVETRDEVPCPIECSDEDKPVCGSNKKTYKNMCHFNREKCRSNEILNLEKEGSCDDE